MTDKEFWQEFLTSTGKDSNTQYFESFYFGITEKSANALLDLVLSGKKRATASSLFAYEATNERVPEVGDFSIVTDWDKNPRCIIETTAVTIMKFKEMTFDICKREGEDENLESWRRNHIWYFTEDGKELGYSFSEEMPVVFEDFEVVYTRP